jgi:hypothetical protein
MPFKPMQVDVIDVGHFYHIRMLKKVSHSAYRLATKIGLRSMVRSRSHKIQREITPNIATAAFSS